jgi:hypothetical protein
LKLCVYDFVKHFIHKKEALVVEEEEDITLKGWHDGGGCFPSFTYSGKVYMFLKLYFVWKYIKIIFFLS